MANKAKEVFVNSLHNQYLNDKKFSTYHSVTTLREICYYIETSEKINIISYDNSVMVIV
jgi:hypothetical protein